MRAIVIVCLLVSAATAGAHQQKASISTMLYNYRSGNLEISHRFYIHDAEHAVSHLFGNKGDIMLSKPLQKKFTEYVHQQFLVKNDKQQMVPLKLLGYQMEGKFLWVLQEVPLVAITPVLYVQHRSLRDIWPKQRNDINIDHKKQIKTLSFHGDIDWLTVNVPLEVKPVQKNQ